MSGNNIPDVDVDIYADAALLNPYENYALLRDTAPIVRLPKYDVYVMSRFADVQGALKNWQLLSSASGVGLNERGNAVLSRSTLGSDDPIHAQRRAVLSRPLAPAKLSAMRARISKEAEQLVEGLVRRQHFDAATELSRYLPDNGRLRSDRLARRERRRHARMDQGRISLASDTEYTAAPGQILRASRLLPSLRP